MGTTATAASQGDVDAPAAGGCGGVWGAVVGWVMTSSRRSLLPLVVARFQLVHLAGGLLGPLGVPLPVGDGHGHGQAGPQPRPALVLLDPDAHRDALHDLGELAGD